MRVLSQRRRRSGKTSPVLVGFLALSILVGLGIFVFGGYLLIKSMQSNSWPSTDGIVKSAKMKTEQGDESITYTAEITYEYTVNRKPFTGDKIRMVKVGNSNQSYANQDLQKYPAGTKVTVFYSPGDPADCVLEPGVHPSSWFLPGIGGAFVLFPLIGVAATFFLKIRPR
jgi:hypothetical protein